MKKVYILLTIISGMLLASPVIMAQVPDGFSYQAVARDNTGDPLTNTPLLVRVAILSAVSPDVVVWEEEHSVTTNSLGLFTLVVGDITASYVDGTAGSFASIDWNSGEFFLRPSVKETSGTWQLMSPSKIESVAFSMLAKDTETKQQLSLVSDNLLLSDGGSANLAKYNNPDQSISLLNNTLTQSNGGSVDLSGYVNQFLENKDTIYKEIGSLSIGSDLPNGSKLAVVSTDDESTEPLFEVRRKDGQPVFSVYNSGVEVHVDDISAKGPRGGFSVGGFDKSPEKGTPVIQKYLIISPDSVRMFIPETTTLPAKGSGSRGGFAVGGFDAAKGTEKLYFNLSGRSDVDIFLDVPRMLWYPQKEAFQAGRINITDATDVGQNSTAFGYHPMAKGDYSQAFGRLASATGQNSTAIGHQASAQGLDSYAFGSGAIASGINAFAFGSGGIDTTGTATGLATTASGTNSVALGMGAQATNTGSMAFGQNAKTTGYLATSMGYYAQASGSYSMALGYRASALDVLSASFGVYSRADGRYALSLGYSSDALNDYSVSIGYNAQATGLYATGVGYNTIAGGTYSTAIGYRAKATGIDSYAFGSQAEALGEKSFAIGTFGLNADGTPNAIATKASGPYSLALGMGSVSVNTGSIAIGVNTTSNSDFAVAVGNGAVATGEYATALGYRASANGDKAISIGAYYNTTIMRFIYNPITRRFEITYVPIEVQNQAIGEYSIALGNGNYATNGGFAIGSNNDAKGYGAVAIGHTNYADSAYSFAAGNNNYSRSIYSFAMGYNLYAEAANSFVVGRYNTLTGTRNEWIDNEPLFVVGNGGGSSTRNDAFVVFKNGDAVLDGDLTVTGSISASGIGDGLGNHIATQNIRMNNFWLSGDGANEGVFVSSTGLVGINDATPSYTLDVAGTARVTSNFYASGRSEIYATDDASGVANTGGLEIANSLRLDGNEVITNSNTTLYLQNDNNGDLSVDGGTFFVDASANFVGIGNTAPAYNLDVTGTLHSSGALSSGSTVSASGAVSGGSLNTGSWELDHVIDKITGQAALVTTYSGNTRFAISTTGSLLSPASYSTAVGTTRRALYVDDRGLIGYASSSRRYKDNITSIGSVEWIYDLNPVNYYYKNDVSKTLQFGLIAEEVEQVNPLFVSYNEDGEVETVNYNDLIAPLIKAVQEQKESGDENLNRISHLENENASLRAENDELRSRIEQLEAAVSTILQKEK